MTTTLPEAGSVCRRYPSTLYHSPVDEKQTELGIDCWKTQKIPIFPARRFLKKRLVCRNTVKSLSKRCSTSQLLPVVWKKNKHYSQHNKTKSKASHVVS